jgi:hypothetical protein
VYNSSNCKVANLVMMPVGSDKGANETRPVGHVDKKEQIMKLGQ